MRIAMVSTYPPIECGLASYSQYLAEALKKTENEIFVISQYGAGGDHVIPAYDPSENGLSKKIFDIVKKITPDIVHIQHEFGLYGDMDGIAILDLIFRMKFSNITVAATLHTVRNTFDYRKKMVFQTMCRELDIIIVHEKEHIKILKDCYGINPSKIYHVDHGIRTMTPYEDAKKKLGLEGKKVVLLLGYIRETKGFHRIIDLFPSIVERENDACLVLASKVRVSELNEYRQSLFMKIKKSPVSDHIEVFRGKFPQKTFDYILSGADIVALPYVLGAQSGIMAHALSLGKPVVASNLQAFNNVIGESNAGLIARDDNEFIDKISKLLTDDNLRSEMSKNALKYVRNKLSWDLIAKATSEIYHKYDRELICKSKHVYIGD
ncbi:MAG TPA: glycosyltransferase [Victivallales bacterium]|nr:glycosyltransferase [Victivallales bacterium]